LGSLIDTVKLRIEQKQVAHVRSRVGLSKADFGGCIRPRTTKERPEREQSGLETCSFYCNGLTQGVFRVQNFLGVLLLSGADAPPKSAFDKPTLEAYVRHLFLLNPQLTVSINEPKPAVFPASRKSASALPGRSVSGPQPLCVQRRKKIVQGNFYDVANNPFKPELDKLKTQFQPALELPERPWSSSPLSDLQLPALQDGGANAA